MLDDPVSQAGTNKPRCEEINDQTFGQNFLRAGDPKSNSFDGQRDSKESNPAKSDR